MDNFDFNEEPAKRSSRTRLGLWDLLSLLVLFSTFCLGGYFALVFVNPHTPLNLFPPLATLTGFPSATITPIQLEPTWTPTSIQVTITNTLVPTITLQPSPTSFSLVPATKTPKVSPTPTSPFSATITSIASTIIPHLTDLGCNWQGVGGTVMDTNNSPIKGIVIRLIGTLNGQPVEHTIVSGISPDYGPSGFEFTLGTTPVASTATLYVQLLDQAGLPLADNVYINTYKDCNKNLTLVRFKKNR